MSNFILSNKGIDEVSAAITEFLTSKNVERRNVSEIRISAENTMLFYQKVLGEDSVVSLSCGKKFRHYNVTLEFPGTSENPFSGLSYEDALMNKALQNMGTAPTWNYKHGNNEIAYSIKKKSRISTPGWILVAVVLGILLGLLASKFAEKSAIVLCESYLVPVSDHIMGLMCTFASFLIFFAVINGIMGMGNISTFNKIGKSLIKRFISTQLIAFAIGVAVSLTFFQFTESSGGTIQLKDMWELILNIIPTNIVQAFIDGNAIQIIFLAVFIGLISLYLSSKVSIIIDIVQQLNDILIAAMEVIFAFMPVVVFISLFNVCVTSELSDFASAVKILVLMIPACIALMVIITIETITKNKISFRLLFSKLSASFITAFMTSSSMVVLPTNIDTCDNKLGISPSISRIGIPLGQSMQESGVMYEIFFGCFTIAQMYHIDVSMETFIGVAISAFIISFAIPPVAGGGIFVYTIFFNMIGIPLSGISILVALDVLMDRACTVTKHYNLLCGLITQARKLDMLDEEMLFRQG